jgi:hypothetical protein
VELKLFTAVEEHVMCVSEEKGEGKNIFGPKRVVQISIINPQKATLGIRT